MLGHAGTVAVISVLALGGADAWLLLPTLFVVGASTMVAIPTIQVRLTRLAPEAPTLMGAINLAALNVANAIGAWGDRLVIAAGFGPLAAVWAGLVLTLAGLAVFALTLPRAPRLAPA